MKKSKKNKKPTKLLKPRNEHAMALAVGKFKPGPMLTKLKQQQPRHAKHKKQLLYI